MKSLQIVYASTSGHTEYVIGQIVDVLRASSPALNVVVTRVELASPETLLQGDVLLLASGTWNTGGIEGQLNPYMHALLKEKAAAVELNGKKVAVVALGDARYRYTARAGEHLKTFVETHGGELLGEPLVIVNEPYGQEAKAREWAEIFSSLLA